MDLSYSATEQAFDWAQYILLTVGAFAAIATLTPNKTDDKIMQRVLDFINMLGMNFGKAANPKEETSDDAAKK